MAVSYQRRFRQCLFPPLFGVCPPAFLWGVSQDLPTPDDCVRTRMRLLSLFLTSMVFQPSIVRGVTSGQQLGCWALSTRLRAARYFLARQATASRTSHVKWIGTGIGRPGKRSSLYAHRCHARGACDRIRPQGRWPTEPRGVDMTHPLPIQEILTLIKAPLGEAQLWALCREAVRAWTALGAPDGG